LQDTSEEAADLRRSFDACDRDGDAAITSDEFRALLRALDQDLSDDECLLAFELADSDGDGVIGFEEFKSWWTDK
jgi:Ca2+-binding EF-hand superfamily protein